VVIEISARRAEDAALAALEKSGVAAGSAIPGPHHQRHHQRLPK
jgi:hypothetical protein